MAKTAVLALASGEVFRGEAFGALGTKTGELVFGASCEGFQQTVSDPALAGKIYVAAYPLAGNCGANDKDGESAGVRVEGVAARECCARPSSFSSARSFSELLAAGGAPGISGLDTRMLVRLLRERGNVGAALSTEGISDEAALALARSFAPARGIIARVSRPAVWRARTPHHTRTIAVLDCGVKRSLVRALNDLRCDAVMLPHDASALEIRALAPDALLVCNGPGSPADAVEAVSAVKALLGELPIFGVGLGFGAIALACGGKIEKMRFSAYGARAVRDLAAGRIITCGFAVTHGVERSSLECAGFTATHEGTDGALYGAKNAALRCAGVLFAPEGAPGPPDAIDVISDFVSSTGREN